MKLRDFARILDPIRLQIASILARGVVVMVDDSGGRQRLQITTLVGDVDQAVEHFQAFGFFAVPMPPDSSGAPEHITARLGGSKSHPVTVVVSDRRYRPRDQVAGSAGLHSSGDNIIRLMPDGSIEITASQAISIAAPSVDFTGDVNIDGSLSVAGAAVIDGDLTAGTVETVVGVSLGGHVHVENDNGGPTQPPT